MGVRGNRNFYFLLGALRVLVLCSIHVVCHTAATNSLVSVVAIHWSHMIWPTKKRKDHNARYYRRAKPWLPVDFRKIASSRFSLSFSKWFHFLQKDKKPINKQYIVVLVQVSTPLIIRYTKRNVRPTGKKIRTITLLSSTIYFLNRV